MINLAALIAVSAVDKLLGETDDSARMLAESDAVNRQSRAAILNIAKTTNDITAQIALRGELLAESIKNGNLRRLREIQAERQRILNS